MSKSKIVCAADNKISSCRERAYTDQLLILGVLVTRDNRASRSSADLTRGLTASAAKYYCRNKNRFRTVPICRSVSLEIAGVSFSARVQGASWSNGGAWRRDFEYTRKDTLHLSKDHLFQKFIYPQICHKFTISVKFIRNILNLKFNNSIKGIKLKQKFDLFIIKYFPDINFIILFILHFHIIFI